MARKEGEKSDFQIREEIIRGAQLYKSPLSGMGLSWVKERYPRFIEYASISSESMSLLTEYESAKNLPKLERWRRLPLIKPKLFHAKRKAQAEIMRLRQRYKLAKALQLIR
ncbi:hypothetical protein [Candidatus Hecatella orcuttiae]|uniref:hypothetical protein n=1 Tax=Candidatus Hecatella orcuttiae TaxID=1935119 RepID=UPI002867E300|nr:hypothetical protein [Candidatus Hecatella orcuttiae]